MKRKISIFLSALLLVPVLLTGCGKDGKKLLEQAAANADAAKAYMLDFTMGCEVEASGSSVEYLYSFLRGTGEHAMMIFRMTHQETAASRLAEQGARLISQQEIDRL